MFKAKGTLIYDPRSDASKFTSWWAKLDVPRSVVQYYQYWVKRELGIHLNTPIWKAHITVMRGEEPRKQWLWKKYQNKEIEFSYTPDIRMSETYAWIPAQSEQLEQIRTELGLRPQPRVPFHITIGNTKNLEKIIKEVKVPFTVFPWEDVKIVDRLWRNQ